jgi:hypothetical protein
MINLIKKIKNLFYRMWVSKRTNMINLIKNLFYRMWVSKRTNMINLIKNLFYRMWVEIKNCPPSLLIFIFVVIILVYWLLEFILEYIFRIPIYDYRYLSVPGYTFFILFFFFPDSFGPFWEFLVKYFRKHWFYLVLVGLCIYSLIAGFFLFEQFLKQLLGPSVSYYRPMTSVIYLYVLFFVFSPERSIQFWIAIFRRMLGK